MEPIRWPAIPTAEAGPSPKSPQEDRQPSPTNSPTLEREKSPTPTNECTSSPEPNCAICLGKSQNKSFTDSCLHQFCFNCLLEWSKVKAECPLCKQSFKSIIHNVRSNEDYDQYHLHPAAENPYPWINMINMDMVQQRFRYRSTLTPDRRLERVMGYLEHDLQRRVEPGDVLPTQRSWRHWRGVAPHAFRRNVYSYNLRLTSLLSVGQPRDVSPQNFRHHPEEMHRLIPWLNRELQAILQNPGLAARVLDLVISQLPHHHIQSREFRAQLETYLREHYNHFIHEFYVFARSPYDMIGFDENARYSERNTGWVDTVHEVPSDSSDSDVMILPSDDSHSRPLNTASTALSVPSSSVAGPSRVILPVDQASNSDINNLSSSHSDISLSGDLQDLARSSRDAETEPFQSNEGNDSDGCVVVGYVKPRHERTPEIITLLSSDPEAVEDDVTEMPEMPYTDCYSYEFSSSTSSPESSGSEYNPFHVRNSQRKKKKKKKKKVQRKGKSDSSTKSKARTSHKGNKVASSSTKWKGHSKPEFSNSDSDSSACTCTGKRSIRRKRARSFSSSSSSSSASGYSHSSSRISLSSISSSSSNHDYKSRQSRSSHTRCRSKRSPCRNKKESWRIQINMPDMKQEHDYSDTGCESRCTSPDVNNIHHRSSSNGRPKLRSIVITRASNCSSKYQASGNKSHDRLQKSRTTRSKSHRQEGAQKKLNNEPGIAPSTSNSNRPHHRGDSHSSHSSHRLGESNSSKSTRSNERIHSMENERKKQNVVGKKQRGSRSPSERDPHETKPKKRKKMSPLYSELSND